MSEIHESHEIEDYTVEYDPHLEEDIIKIGNDAIRVDSQVARLYPPNGDSRETYILCEPTDLELDLVEGTEYYLIHAAGRQAHDGLYRAAVENFGIVDEDVDPYGGGVVDIYSGHHVYGSDHFGEVDDRKQYIIGSYLSSKFGSKR